MAMKRDGMTCPKCGVQQPLAESCSSCQIIIAKYLQRQNVLMGREQAGGSPLITAPVSGGFPVGRLMLALLVLVWLVGGYLWSGRSAAKGVYQAGSGRYFNEKFKFALQLPNDWKILTVKQAIQCSTLRDQYADQYLLLASPTIPAECLLVVNIAGISLDYFRNVGWEGLVAEINGRNRVKFSEVRNINGLTVYRVGYDIAGFYREDAYFEAGNKLIELYYYLPMAADTADRISRLRDLVNEKLRRL